MTENLRRSSRITARIRDTSDNEDAGTPVKNLQGTRTPSKRKIRDSPNSNVETVTNLINKPEVEQQLETIEEVIQRPAELFTEEDVSATLYYGFRTPTKKNAMAQKAMECRTPATPRASNRVHLLKVTVEKSLSVKTPKSKEVTTPSISRTFKTDRKRLASGVSSSESESVSEDSEFVPTDSDNETSGNENENSDGEDSSDNEGTKTASRGFQFRKAQISTSGVGRRGKTKNTIAYSDFHLKTDEYFETQSSKVLTSDRTLSRLKNPRLNEAKLQELLGNVSHVSKIHAQRLCRLTENYKSLFPMWYHIMEEGYSLLVHGLGSKRNLINDFHKEVVVDYPTLIVNGFFPSLTMKDILDSIVTELLGRDSPTNPNECFNLVEDVLQKNPDDRLYLLIHNIDGAMLRSSKVQDTLSRLAAIPNIRFLASVDHINAPLIWDNVKRSRYNFYWWDATTLLPYEAETSYESSLLVQQSGALALSSLHNVFQSLTTNTKAIYILLVKHQLENGKTTNYPGMAFKDLYRGAREGFLVSSDLALRSQMTEFIDHKLVRMKRNMDGTEYLVIPLDNSLLQQFLDQRDGT